MRIKEILCQTRNDFRAIMECEHCGFTHTNNNGYDDRKYHNNVIPAMICPKCKKNRLGDVE